MKKDGSPKRNSLLSPTPFFDLRKTTINNAYGKEKEDTIVKPTEKMSIIDQSSALSPTKLSSGKHTQSKVETMSPSMAKSQASMNVSFNRFQNTGFLKKMAHAKHDINKTVIESTYADSHSNYKEG